MPLALQPAPAAPTAPPAFPGQTILPLCVRSCPVMLVVGDNAPAEDGVVSEGVGTGVRGPLGSGQRPVLDPAQGHLRDGGGGFSSSPTCQASLLQLREAWRPRGAGPGPGHLPTPSSATPPPSPPTSGQRLRPLFALKCGPFFGEQVIPDHNCTTVCGDRVASPVGTLGEGSLGLQALGREFALALGAGGSPGPPGAGSLHSAASGSSPLG